MIGSPHQQDVMPSRAAERVCHSVSLLIDSSTASLSPTLYQQILYYCGVRPNIVGWRSFLRLILTLLGLLALVVGVIFFIAWNWAAMPKMSKFLSAQLFIIALAIVVWWRWYDAVARIALLAVGLSFGGLFALYGQIYQTGADSWELFYAWAWVLLPLALVGRQNALWFSAWLIANLAFQLYYISQSPNFFADLNPTFVSWLPQPILYGYLVIQIALLLIREAFAEYALKTSSSGWLASRWCSRVMVAYLLLTLTPLVTDSIWDENFTSLTPYIFLGVVLAVIYRYYRYHRPDLCMLIFGVIALIAVGYALIIRFVSFWDISTLFISGMLMVLLLIAGCALLLYWRRQMFSPKTENRRLDGETRLLQELHHHQLLTDRQMAEVAKRDPLAHLPWYLRGALAIACWVAGLISLCLLLLLLYITDLLNESADISLILASLVIAVLARVMLRTTNIGKRHIGLSWAIVATCGLCIGVYLLVEPLWSHHEAIGTFWWLPIIALMALAMPDPWYRMMAVAAWVFLFIPSTTALISLYLSEKLTFVLMVVLIAAIIALWLGVLARQQHAFMLGHQALMQALLYGIPIGLAAQSLTDMPSDLFDDLFRGSAIHYDLPLILGSGIAAGIIVSGLVQAFAFKSVTRKVYLPAAIVCGGLAIFSPGIGLGLTLLLAARYQGSNGLLALVGCFLAWYLVNWYYFLDVTLLHKSLLLLVSGLLFLCLAWAANKLLPATLGELHEN